MASVLQRLIERKARVEDQILRLAARVANGDDGAIQLTRALTERVDEITAILAEGEETPFADPEVNNASQMPSSSDVIHAAYPDSTGGDTPV